MGLVTSLRIAHGHCAIAVLWPTPQQDRLDQERRALDSAAIPVPTPMTMATCLGICQRG